MKDIQALGVYADIAEAPSPLNANLTVRLGVRSQTFRNYRSRRLITPFAQYYGIVQDELILARHAFRGLKRPLMLADDTDADKNVYVYSWRPQFDYEWVGSQFDGQPTKLVPFPGRVFVVIVRKEASNAEDVFGSIERWNWVEEDAGLPEAPVEWQERYEEKLWSKIK